MRHRRSGSNLGQPGRLADVRIDQLNWGGLKPGTQIGKPEAVFPRVDKKEASERIEAMENEIRNPGSTPPQRLRAASLRTAAAPAQRRSAAPAAAPRRSRDAKITIEDFAKVELRVGLMKSAERIQGADKLLKTDGRYRRRSPPGRSRASRSAYAPEELVGRKVVVVTNLAPRKMRGLESNGMLARRIGRRTASRSSAPSPKIFPPAQGKVTIRPGSSF